ncbi:SDR family NAD(P)-dependent oxidoreductase [Chloroflexota bacterium]
MLLNGKVIIITGAANGIGRTSAILFAAEGAKVVIGDIDDQGGLEVVKNIELAGNKAIFCHTDVTVVPELNMLVKAAIDTYGKLDIYWHNAGIVAQGMTLGETTEEIFDSQMAAHVKAGFFGAKFAAPEITKSGSGSILFTASTAGIKPPPFASPSYAVSKVGLVMLTKSLAISLAKENIRVNCICPGAVNTATLQKFIGQDAELPKKVEQLVQQVPIGRFLTESEMAETALFLVSEKASGITGVILPVDGGRTAS